MFKKDLFSFENILITALVLLLPLSHKEAFSVYDPDLVWSKIALILCALGGLYVLSKNLKTYLHDVFFIFLSLIVFFQLLSLFSTYGMSDSLRFIGFQISVLFLYVFVKDFLIRFKEAPAKIITLYTITIVYLVLFVTRQIYLQENFGRATGGVWPVPGYPTRYGGTFWDVNHFAAYLAAAFFLITGFLVDNALRRSHEQELSPIRRGVLYLALKFKGFSLPKIAQVSRIKLFWTFLAVLFIPVGLKLSGSRSASLGFLAGGFVFFYLLIAGRKNLRKSISSPSFYSGLGLVLTLIPVGLIVFLTESLRKAFLYRAVSFYAHLFLLKVGIITGFQNFIWGVGVNAFSDYFKHSKFADAYYYIDRAALNLKLPLHNLWLETWVETGLLSFVIFILFWVALLYSLFKIYRHKTDYIALGMMSGIISFLVGGLFYSYKSEFFWFFVVFACAYASLNYSLNYSNQNFSFKYWENKVYLLLAVVVFFLPLVFFTFPLNNQEINYFYAQGLFPSYQRLLDLMRYIIGNYTFTGRALSALFYVNSFLLFIGAFRNLQFSLKNSFLVSVLLMSVINIYHPLVSVSPLSFYVFLASIVFSLICLIISKYDVNLNFKLGSRFLIILILLTGSYGWYKSLQFYHQAYNADLTFLIELAANRSKTNDAVIFIKSEDWKPLVNYYTDRLEDDEKGNFYFVTDSVWIPPAYDWSLYLAGDKVLILTDVDQVIPEPLNKTNSRLDIIKQGAYQLVLYEKKVTEPSSEPAPDSLPD